jgi:hypothetical protein
LDHFRTFANHSSYYILELATKHRRKNLLSLLDEQTGFPHRHTDQAFLAKASLADRKGIASAVGRRFSCLEDRETRVGGRAGGVSLTGSETHYDQSRNRNEGDGGNLEVRASVGAQK